MLYRAYGPEQRARVARTVIVPVLLGPGIAPGLGGAACFGFFTQRPRDIRGSIGLAAAKPQRQNRSRYCGSKKSCEAMLGEHVHLTWRHLGWATDPKVFTA